ncbi:MAG: hypothetical protein AB7G93_19835 [Bdellovibrionales bacterium]
MQCLNLLKATFVAILLLYLVAASTAFADDQCDLQVKESFADCARAVNSLRELDALSVQAGQIANTDGARGSGVAQGAALSVAADPRGEAAEKLCTTAESACEKRCGERSEESCKEIRRIARAIAMERGVMNAQRIPTATMTGETDQMAFNRYRVFEKKDDHGTQFTVPILPRDHHNHLSVQDVLKATGGGYKCVRNCN